MRDLLIVGLVAWGCLAALKRPWIGVLLWTWLSIMNPHRYSYGFAYDAPLAAMSAAATFAGLLFTADRRSPFIGSPAVWFLLFSCWVTLSWANGLNRSGDYPQWDKVMKINLMIFVAAGLIISRLQIVCLAFVVVLSLSLLGSKGGAFTVMTGGSYRVWGPPGSFIADNNEFALALVMTIPLLRFLQLQCTRRWFKRMLLLMMVLCAASALGSHSRGALLAIASMGAYFWWRGKNKFAVGVGILAVAIVMLSFMPDEWFARMNTIKTYEEDASAMGRISAWWTAWNLAWVYPTGVGFNPARADLFALYSPYPEAIHAAHSIYFQVLGNHGFVGLLLYLGIWFSTWRSAAWLVREGVRRRETQWCSDLGRMCQVALLAFAVGGAFLSLAYFDLPYEIMVLVMAARAWLQGERWRQERVVWPAWSRYLGIDGFAAKEGKS